MNKIHAFTLIELLVVVSIIGILASVVLSSLSSARDKGKIGAAIEFSTTNYHAFGADVFAWYDFNEPITGGILKDMGGRGIDLGSCTGLSLSTDNPNNSPSNTSGNFTWAGGAAPAIGCSYTLTTAGNLPSYTLSGWIKMPTSPAGGTMTIIGFNSASSGYIGVIDATGNAYCGASAYFGAAQSTTILQTGRWYHIACSLDPSLTMNLYVNGVKEKTKTVISTISWIPNDTVLMWNDTSTGLLDDVAVYTHSLSESDIYQIFAAGAVKHGIALLK